MVGNMSCGIDKRVEICHFPGVDVGLRRGFRNI